MQTMCGSLRGAGRAVRFEDYFFRVWGLRFGVRGVRFTNVIFVITVTYWYYQDYYLVVSPNSCSQNGGNVYRAPYYNWNPNIRARVMGNLDQDPFGFRAASKFPKGRTSPSWRPMNRLALKMVCWGYRPLADGHNSASP